MTKRKQLIDRAQRDMLWAFFRDGVFRRIKLYNGKDPQLSNDKRKKLIRKHLESLLCEYRKSINPDQHISNIKSFETQFKSKYFECGFGVSQKMVNLYLKGARLIGFIEIDPPHFPLDGIMQNKLKMKRKSYAELSEGHYKDALTIANSARKKRGLENLFELEIDMYNNK